MPKNCKNCEESVGGFPDPCSDCCDGCKHDSDTGWGGFTDHSIGKHFNSEDERQEYLKKILNDDAEGKVFSGMEDFEMEFKNIKPEKKETENKKPIEIDNLGKRKLGI